MTAFMTISKEEPPVIPDQNEKVLQKYIDGMSRLIVKSSDWVCSFLQNSSIWLLLILTKLPFQVKQDEEYDLEMKQEMARLRYENKYLGKCLKIGHSAGSITKEDNSSVPES